MNTAWLLSIPAALFPDQEILVFGGTRLTYSQLNHRVNRLTRGLRSLGLGRGSRIGMLQHNCNQYVETYFATSKLGGTFVALNCRAKLDEIKYIITAADVDALVVGDRYWDIARSVRPELPSVRHWIAFGSGLEGVLCFDNLTVGTPCDEVDEEMNGDETNLLTYPCGTTSAPKAEVLSYRHFVEHVLGRVEPADGVRWSATLLAVPLWQTAALITMMSSIYGGRKLVLMPRFDAQERLRLALRESVANPFQPVGVGIIVSDLAGRISYSTLDVRKLARPGGANQVGMLGSSLQAGLRSNLQEIVSSGKHCVESTVRVTWGGKAEEGRLALRSVLVPSRQGNVVTLAYNLQPAPDFERLTLLLSPREIEVMELLAQGLRNKEIAESLDIAPNTVKHHLKQVFLKMQVSSRSELLSKALQFFTDRQYLVEQNVAQSAPARAGLGSSPFSHLSLQIAGKTG